MTDPEDARMELFQATKFHRIDLIRGIVEERPWLVNERRIGGIVPIQDAILFGSREALVYFMDLGADLNVTDDDGWTLLHSAVKLGDWKIVDLILRACLRKINKRNREGKVPLHYCNDGGVARLLISNGARTDVASKWGRLPIHTCLEKGDDVLRVFIDNGMEIDTPTRNKFRHTPLYCAIENGNMVAVEFLLENRAQIDSSILDVAREMQNEDIYELIAAVASGEIGFP